MQFIKISKELRKELTNRELILYGMIAAYLSIPGFETTHGGFKKMLKTRLSNGSYVFDEAWHGLRRKGYLKMLRFPIGESKFAFRYELRSVADLKTPAKQSLTAYAGRQYLAKRHPLYTEPRVNYYVISREVLLDPRLSLHDKWLWMVMRDQMDLFEKGLLKDRDGAEKRYLVKEDIRLATGFRAGNFERAWGDLKREKYLHTARFFDRQYGVTRFEYTLTANTIGLQNGTCVDRRVRRTVDEKLPPIGKHAVTSTHTAPPRLSLDYKAVEAVVKENIHYAGLLQFAEVRQPDGFYYSKGNLDAVVSRMVSAICCKSHTMRVNGSEMPVEVVRERMVSLDSENILNALRGVWAVESEGGEIGNKRAYLLTALFNSIEG